MKKVEDYDKHLQDFYAQSFREYALQNGIDSHYRTSKAEDYANEMLFAYGEAFNKSIAQELLKRISLVSNTHEEKLHNYPILFWKTQSGITLLREMSNKINHHEVQKLFNTTDLNIQDLTNSFKKVLVFAEKISLKNEQEGLSLVKNFNMNLSKMISQKIELKQIDNTQAQSLYNNMIKEVLVPDILEKHIFPELQATLQSIAYNVKKQEEKIPKAEHKSLKI